MATASPEALVHLLGSRTRAGLLQVLVDAPERAWSVRGAAAAAGLDYKTCRSELARLAEMGLTRTTGAGRSRRHGWNRDHPAARHLEGLVRELADLGVARIIRHHLEDLDWVEEAMIHGSWAAGTHRDESDVDLILVGRAEDAIVHAAMEALELRLGRDVDYRIYDPPEFDALRRRRGFAASVLAKPHVVVKRAA